MTVSLLHSLVLFLSILSNTRKRKKIPITNSHLTGLFLPIKRHLPVNMTRRFVWIGWCWWVSCSLISLESLIILLVCMRNASCEGKQDVPDQLVVSRSLHRCPHKSPSRFMEFQEGTRIHSVDLYHPAWEAVSTPYQLVLSWYSFRSLLMREVVFCL